MHSSPVITEWVPVFAVYNTEVYYIAARIIRPHVKTVNRTEQLTALIIYGVVPPTQMARLMQSKFSMYFRTRSFTPFLTEVIRWM